MNASEVTQILQQLIAEHGDLEVQYPYEIEASKGHYDYYGSCDINRIRFVPEGNVFYID